jgi:hypothetical protein
MLILLAACGVFGQQKTLRAEDLIAQIISGKAVIIENAVIVGDLDLTNLPNQINDAVYPEQEKTARVFSGIISQIISFKNVRFAGNVNLFRTTADEKEIREYRVQFKDAVSFENCTFEKEVNFGLTNFDGQTSFANSVFKQKPLFIRIGLNRAINFEGTIFEQNSIFQFTQADEKLILSVNELQNLIKKLGCK